MMKDSCMHEQDKNEQQLERLTSSKACSVSEAMLNVVGALLKCKSLEEFMMQCDLELINVDYHDLNFNDESEFTKFIEDFYDTKQRHA